MFLSWFVYPYKMEEGEFWALDLCMYRLVESKYIDKQLENFVEEGCLSGGLAWSIWKYSEEVSLLFNVEEYEGYLVFLGKEEHGGVEGDLISIYTKKDVLKRLMKICNLYLIFDVFNLVEMKKKRKVMKYRRIIKKELEKELNY